ncbi:hypothetical protein KC318_g1662 [Hortaea werneckii]|nr:hypothetical protein KC334_g1376 [Hortaea werneckii]KAI7674326.1 hypothetical protein KC318_g1662 [Hortaea werneckii]
MEHSQQQLGNGNNKELPEWSTFADMLQGMAAMNLGDASQADDGEYPVCRESYDGKLVQPIRLSCCRKPISAFIQTRLTGGAVTDIAAYNETSQTFHYEPIVPEGGINACINGDCSLPGETEVVEDSCYGAVSVFTVDYSAPLGDATTDIRQRLTPLVSFQEGSNDTDTSATSSSSAAPGSTSAAGGYGWGGKGSKHFGNGWGKGPQHGPPSRHHWNPRYAA